MQTLKFIFCFFLILISPALLLPAAIKGLLRAIADEKQRRRGLPIINLD